MSHPPDMNEFTAWKKTSRLKDLHNKNTDFLLIKSRKPPNIKWKT